MKILVLIGIIIVALLFYFQFPVQSGPFTQTIDPTLNLNNASFTFNLILTRPSNTLQLVSATDTATILFINQHMRFVLNIPAQNGGASSTVDTLTPGASALFPWKANVPGTFPSGTYNYLMFLGIECFNNCAVSSTVATGTFTIN